MSTTLPAVEHEMTQPKPQSAPDPGADAPGRRSRTESGAWARLRDNALVAVLGGAVIGLTVFAHTSLDRDIERLDDKIEELRDDIDTKIEELGGDIDTKIEELGGDIDTKIEELGGDIDAKIERLDDKIAAQDAEIEQLDDKIDGIDLKLTALIARLEESGTIRAPGDGAGAAGT